MLLQRLEYSAGNIGSDCHNDVIIFFQHVVTLRIGPV
jgi:hypothetical protein